MHIAFRTDASSEIGTGHLMRCIALADALAFYGVRSSFVCRSYSNVLLDMVEKRGYTLHKLPVTESSYVGTSGASYSKWLGADWATDARQTKSVLIHQPLDLLVVDHYAVDYRWQSALRCCVKRILVIDDLADRSHDCDLLLDQNLGRSSYDYFGKVNINTKILTGTKYALLRPEFSSWREYSLRRRTKPKLKTLLITMGGIDAHNATGKVLDVLVKCELPKDLRIKVVLGRSAPSLYDVRCKLQEMPLSTELLVDPKNIAKVMADSDLAIGAAGSTAWERCCLGLPTLMVSLADNQYWVLNALTKTLAAKEFSQSIFEGITEAQLLEMSTNSAALVDGKGLGRVVQTILKNAQ